MPRSPDTTWIDLPGTTIDRIKTLRRYLFFYRDVVESSANVIRLIEDVEFMLIAYTYLKQDEFVSEEQFEVLRQRYRAEHPEAGIGER